MAGTIQADYLQPTSSAGLTILTPSGNTVASINTSGVFSTTGSLMLSANGTIITSTYATLTANTLQIGQSGSSSNNFTLYQPSTPDGTVRLRNIGTANDLVTVTSTGNMGIGTSSPAGKLDVRGPSGYLGYFRDSGTGGYASFKTDASGPIIEYGNGSAGLRFADGGAEKMRLDASGNLGIGVTPSYKLDVNGYLRAGGTSPNASGINVFNSQQYVYTTANWNYSNLNLIRPSTNTSTPRFLSFMLDGDSEASTTIGGYPAIWGVYSGTPTTGSTSSGLSAKMGLASYAGFNYYINGTQAMTLDASGNLLVGTTSNLYGSRLNVKSAGDIVAAEFYRQGTAGGSAIVVFNSNATATESLRSYIDTSSGNLTVVSDERVKDNIEDIEYGLSEVLALRPVSFKWKNSFDEQVNLGFIAQEVEQVISNVVTTLTEDISHTLSGQKMMDKEALIPVLVKAIQELSAELNIVKSELAELKSRG